ncbi:hypothetical protein GLAREA_03566 [Glarea lozoyensis ATCC 20868]|uniref:Uncharacterized protein n=1 Tax=Glarea lozoyensis (strain ATCC 20868 / MF5171) TaxID=1116229 RepID=S3D0A5_GLAL2|nr:uncharacterized protein GLAREA_03566 [Glarea lozoyensis ATCC 20868]EPE30599.1 hypothetical protein GLAREA_03566 [Glarea lozoyensis ATCC 20868]
MEPPRLVRKSSCLGFDSRYEDPAIVKFNADILRQKLLEVNGPPVWLTPDELYIKVKYAGMKPWEIPMTPTPPDTPSGSSSPIQPLQKSIEEDRDPNLPTPRPYDSPPNIYYRGDSYPLPLDRPVSRPLPQATILPKKTDSDYEYELLTVSQQPSIWHDYPIEAHLEWYERECISLPDGYVKPEQKRAAERQTVHEQHSQKSEQKEKTTSSKQNSQHSSRRTKRKQKPLVLSETSTNHIRKRPCHHMTTRSRDGSISPNASYQKVERSQHEMAKT